MDYTHFLFPYSSTKYRCINVFLSNSHYSEMDLYFNIMSHDIKTNCKLHLSSITLHVHQNHKTCLWLVPSYDWCQAISSKPKCQIRVFSSCFQHIPYFTGGVCHRTCGLENKTIIINRYVPVMTRKTIKMSHLQNDVVLKPSAYIQCFLVLLELMMYAECDALNLLLPSYEFCAITPTPAGIQVTEW